MAKRYGVSLRTLNRWFSMFWNNIPFPIIPDNLDNDVLVIDAAEVQANSRLIADLGAESIDFLDLVFQLEKEF